MCVGEAPGKHEDHGGRPFIGDAGREFNENYLGLAGLSRDEVYVTNSRKCRPDLNRKPTAKETWSCAQHHMPEELAEVRPRVVMLMGATACSLIPDIDLEVEHGIPREGELFGWRGWVVPMFHPALGLHSTGMMQPMLEDWERLRPWFESDLQDWTWKLDGFAGGGRDYALIDHAYADRFRGGWITEPWIAVDTETHDGKPWSVQYSWEVGKARMVRLDDPYVVQWWVALMRRSIYRGSELVFHNAPADLDLVMSLGVQGFRWRDTMQEAYHLGNLPQGLKALSYRLLGRRRKSWEETVTPASKIKLCGWMYAAAEAAQIFLTERIERVSEKTGKQLKPKFVKSEQEKILKSILMHAMSSDGYDPWEKLKERFDPVGFPLGFPLVEVAGERPAKGIAHIPLDEAVYYGCSDADDTLAVAEVLEGLRRGVGEVVREEDRDAVNQTKDQTVQRAHAGHT